MVGLDWWGEDGHSVVLCCGSAENMQLTGSIRAWCEGIMYLRPSCVVFRSCACAAEERKCDLHAGPLEFGIGFGSRELLILCYSYQTSEAGS